MKNLINLLLVYLCFSCSETLEGLEQLNTPPRINFSKEEHVTVLKDSIKLSSLYNLKADPKGYEIELEITDPNNNLVAVSYQSLFGRGILLQDQDTIRGRIQFLKDRLELMYYPSVLGNHRFEISAVDGFGKRSSAVVELEAFHNLSPVALYTFSREGQFGRRHWVFDASESHDRDEKYGGFITAYEFHNGMGRVDIVEVPQEPLGVNYEPWKYHVIFPEDNIYTIGVRVRDSDGKWSALVRRDVTVD